MGNEKVNVLVYSGNGSTVESVRHCMYTLRRVLGSNYAVVPVNGDVILKEPWTASCALLVFPGGADLGYCRTLNGAGNRRIEQYVRRGGAYLGLCAGGYYGSRRCEFEVGNKNLEVVGPRELAFFPGTCRGCAFSGFVYHSEAGAKAAQLKVNQDSFNQTSGPESLKSYYNGGGVFVDAEKFRDRGVEILARYASPLDVEGGEESASVVHCKVGEGHAVLTGPHPEFAPINLDPQAGDERFRRVVSELYETDQDRIAFLKACLIKLDLNVSKEEQAVPTLSRLHLSSSEPSNISSLLSSLKSAIAQDGGDEVIRGDNDLFVLRRSSRRWSFETLSRALSNIVLAQNGSDTNNDRNIDYNRVRKQLQVHESDLPACKETPYLNHNAFYANLNHYHVISGAESREFGKYIMYGEVVTSTSTMLEKNPQLLRNLPTGFTSTATVQVAGRGRGSNVWVSPAGSLMFSTCIRHPHSSSSKSPVVFVQYIAAMAVVEGIKSYDRGYDKVPVRLKWPNDIYALDPAKPHERSYVKIGGIMVNSSFVDSKFLLVIGIGINTTNSLPTTSLNALLPKHLTPFTLEKLLARILVSFESLYRRFLRGGFQDDLLQLYYSHWLHSDQIITIDPSSRDTADATSTRAQIKGISKDWGLLVAEELGWEDRPTGKKIELQSDSNSFDFLKGLMRRKV